jgi:hypothetical protein
MKGQELADKMKMMLEGGAQWSRNKGNNQAEEERIQL